MAPETTRGQHSGRGDVKKMLPELDLLLGEIGL
jgi:hypothetical protein